jgi:hypothetical protein
MSARPALAFTLTVLGLTTFADVAEFARIVRSSDEELRDRFKLSIECNPVVSGVRVPRGQVKVSITCAGESRPAPPARAHERNR